MIGHTSRKNAIYKGEILFALRSHDFVSVRNCMCIVMPILFDHIQAKTVNYESLWRR